LRGKRSKGWGLDSQGFFQRLVPPVDILPEMYEPGLIYPGRPIKHMNRYGFR
jgi:hypothetical protein